MRAPDWPAASLASLARSIHPSARGRVAVALAQGLHLLDQQLFLAVELLALARELALERGRALPLEVEDLLQLTELRAGAVALARLRRRERAGLGAQLDALGLELLDAAVEERDDLGAAAAIAAAAEPAALAAASSVSSTRSLSARSVSRSLATRKSFTDSEPCGEDWGGGGGGVISFRAALTAVAPTPNREN